MKNLKKVRVRRKKKKIKESEDSEETPKVSRLRGGIGKLRRVIPNRTEEIEEEIESEE